MIEELMQIIEQYENEPATPAPTCPFCGSTRLEVCAEGGYSFAGSADDDIHESTICLDCKTLFDF